jgi:hypothetical protein
MGCFLLPSKNEKAKLVFGEESHNFVAVAQHSVLLFKCSLANLNTAFLAI